MNSHECSQFAKFGVGLGNNFETTAGPRIPVIAVQVVGAFTEVNLETNVTADLEAGFRAGDVEIAGAERIANANIFHGLGPGRDDSIGSLCAGDCCESSSGAEKKALEINF